MANDWRETVDAVRELQQTADVDTAPGPSLQWYPTQWLGDPAVQLMSLEAEGAHHRLLMIAWKGFDLDEEPIPCSLPDDPDLLRDLCRATEDGWRALWRQVRRGWKLRDGRLWNLGLCRSYLEQMKKRTQNSRNAKTRWAAEKKRANAPGSDANARKPDANASKSQCSSSSAPSSPSSEDLRDPTGLVGDAEPSHDDAPGLLNPDRNGPQYLQNPRMPTETERNAKRKASENGRRAEMVWRIEECWRVHIEERESYWREFEYVEQPPGAPPTLTKLRRKLIGEALKRLDAHLLGPIHREQWAKESKARAAAAGIFYDAWMTANQQPGPDGRGGNLKGQGGRRYLDPENCWKIHKGKDNAERFAGVFWEAQAKKARTG